MMEPIQPPTSLPSPSCFSGFPSSGPHRDRRPDEGALKPDFFGYDPRHDLKSALQNRWLLGFNTQDTSATRLFGRWERGEKIGRGWSMGSMGCARLCVFGKGERRMTSENVPREVPVMSGLWGCGNFRGCVTSWRLQRNGSAFSGFRSHGSLLRLITDMLFLKPQCFNFGGITQIHAILDLISERFTGGTSEPPGARQKRAPCHSRGCDLQAGAPASESYTPLRSADLGW